MRTKPHVQHPPFFSLTAEVRSGICDITPRLGAEADWGFSFAADYCNPTGISLVLWTTPANPVEWNFPYDPFLPNPDCTSTPRTASYTLLASVCYPIPPNNFLFVGDSTNTHMMLTSIDCNSPTPTPTPSAPLVRFKLGVGRACPAPPIVYYAERNLLPGCNLNISNSLAWPSRFAWGTRRWLDYNSINVQASPFGYNVQLYFGGSCTGSPNATFNNVPLGGPLDSTCTPNIIGFPSVMRSWLAPTTVTYPTRTALSPSPSPNAGQPAAAAAAPSNPTALVLGSAGIALALVSCLALAATYYLLGLRIEAMRPLPPTSSSVADWATKTGTASRNPLEVSS